jgi:hypothetical protein
MNLMQVAGLVQRFGKKGMPKAVERVLMEMSAVTDLDGDSLRTLLSTAYNLGRIEFEYIEALAHEHAEIEVALKKSGKGDVDPHRRIRAWSWVIQACRREPREEDLA